MIARYRSGVTSAALFSFCLFASAGPLAASAALPVTTGDEGGGVTCANCGQNQQQTTTTGAATDGSAANQPNGNGSGFSLQWIDPSDGTYYGGQLMTQVVNADGSVSVNTITISVYGDGMSGGWGMTNNARIPIGGSASITFSGKNQLGNSFEAGWRVQNFGQ